MKEDPMIARIIDLRESKDWTQAELARRLGVDKSVMNKIESGTRKVQTDELIKMSKLFDVPVDYILNGDEGYIKQWKDSIESDVSDKAKVIAAHIDDDATEEDMEDILRYIEFRKKNPLKK